MRQPFSRSLSFLLLVSVLLLNACEVLETPPPATLIPGLVNTYAAQTIAANSQGLATRLSQTPLSTDTPLPIETSPPPPSGPPTATALPAVSTELFSVQQVVTGTLDAEATVVYPTPDWSRILEDGSPAPCNAAKFIEDVTVPDGMRVAMGERFTKIWRIQNIGACTWTPEYALVKVYGNSFGVFSPSWLDQVVKPGEIVDLILNMEAPKQPACWQSNWKLQDPEAVQFGFGYKFQSALYVLVSVYIPGIRFVRDPCNNR